MSPWPTPASALALALLVAGCTPASAPQATPVKTTWQVEGSDAGIASAHLTQSAQDYWGNVPLVRGRDALLRVFLGARVAGLPAPAVRVRLVSTDTGTILGTYLASSPLAVIPTGTFDGVRAATWNARIPGAEIQPGRHLVVELGEVPGVDPARLVATRRIPAIGSLAVRTIAPLAVTIVPIVQAGFVPLVEGPSRRREDWVSLAAAMYPFPRIDVEIGPAHTTSVFLNGTDDSTWSALLDELVALRAAQGSTRHWIGAVRVTEAGIAGQGLIRGAAFLASDDPDHYQRIVAHELGHNLGLRHAPCGTAGGVDPDWPEGPGYYDGGHIGYAGWDPRTDSLFDARTTFDVMSYCGVAATTWISDFSYDLAVDALSTTATAAVAAVAAAPDPPPVAADAADPAAPAPGADPPLPVNAP